MFFERVTQCRGCTAQLDQAFWALGEVPIADALSDTPNDAHMKAPLSLHYCKQCHLLQLDCHIVPDKLFNHRYPYFSSAIASLVNRMHALCEQLVARYQLDSSSAVLEIASNDGYLLQHFLKHEMSVLGIEPSSRQAAIANAAGIPTECTFFTANSARDLAQKHDSFDLIIANNVIAHVPNVNEVLAGIAHCLNKDGVAVFEFHYARDLLEHCQFDTVYHQHVCYFTLTSFVQLLAQHKLYANHVELLDSYGGSLRVHASFENTAEPSVAALLASEQASEICSSLKLDQFGKQVSQIVSTIESNVTELVKQGMRIAGYGAAAKASTLLSACKFDQSTIEYVVDKNTYKHGLFMPGSDIQICGIDQLRHNTPDLLVILAWNYADEIMQELQWFHDQGGQFILIYPEYRVV